MISLYQNTRFRQISVVSDSFYDSFVGILLDEEMGENYHLLLYSSFYYHCLSPVHFVHSSSQRVVSRIGLKALWGGMTERLENLPAFGGLSNLSVMTSIVPNLSGLPLGEGL